MLLLYQGCAQRNNVGNSKTLSRPRAKPSRRWPQDRRELISTRRSWFTNGMTGRAELDRGRGFRGKCKSLSKTTWNHHERRQNNSVENVFQRFASSFVSFLRRKHDFRQRSPTFVWRILSKNPEFEPLVSTGELAFWSPWPQLKNVLTCAVAVMLQKYFRLASAVPRMTGA